MSKHSFALGLILFVGLLIAGWLDAGGPPRPMAAPAVPTAIVLPSATPAPLPWQAAPTATTAPVAVPEPEPTPIQYLDGQVVSDLTPLP